MNRVIAVFLMVIAITCSASAIADTKSGQIAPNFTATTTAGEEISLGNFKGKFIVVEWFNPSCPFTGKHYNSKNMQTLQKYYTAKNVVWISVVSESSDAPMEKVSKKINEWITSIGSSASYVVIDKNSKIASLYQAKTTPHMFVINPEGTLIYSGAIDDKRSTDLEDVATAKNYVAAALDEAMSGKDVEIKNTRPYGCAVK